MIVSPYARWYPVASEPLIAEDAKTVAHVWWPNGSIEDTKGNSWAQNGTVPQTVRLMTLPANSGPFSDTNYYSLGTGNDALDFGSDFSVYVVWTDQNSTDLQGVVFVNGNFGAAGAGYRCTILPSAGNVNFDTFDAGSTFTRCTASGLVVGLNVACFGRAGTTQFLKLNLGAIVSTAGAKNVPATGNIAKIGRDEAAGVGATSMIMYEALFSTTTPTDALFTAIMQNVKGKLGITAW